MLQWKLQSLLSKVLPNEVSASYSVRVFGVLILLGVVALIAGCIFKRRRLRRGGIALAVSVLVVWGALHATRPAWLRIATQSEVPTPEASPLRWEPRSPGLETAELDLTVNGVWVDRMMLVRLDPKLYRLTVHWDSTATRRAEDWQRELGATVVVSGTYFGGEDHAPLTPLRLSGQSAGPFNYESSHGALVADHSHVDILDLRSRDVFQAINAYPEAMVSYPLLIDANGGNRAVDSKGWLASRNFVALDQSDHLVLGTTETGFFSLRRFGDFLKTSQLGLRIALNFDGGPLVSQVVRAGEFNRAFHGTAEMSDGNDVLRAFWHSHFEAPWTLPVVLVAEPVSSN
jgi:hypothetical protein